MQVAERWRNRYSLLLVAESVLQTVGRQVASEAQLYEGKRAWRIEAVASALMRQGGSELRDAFVEALVESKSASTDKIQHAMAVSNYEGSLDAVAAAEEAILGQELAVQTRHIQCKASTIHRELRTMRDIMLHAVQDLSCKQHLYDFFATAHRDWVHVAAESMSMAGMRRLWHAELRLQWMEARLGRKDGLIAMLNKEAVALRAAASESGGATRKAAVRVGPLGPMPRRIVPAGGVAVRAPLPSARGDKRQGSQRDLLATSVRRKVRVQGAGTRIVPAAVAGDKRLLPVLQHATVDEVGPTPRTIESSLADSSDDDEADDSTTACLTLTLMLTLTRRPTTATTSRTPSRH